MLTALALLKLLILSLCVRLGWISESAFRRYKAVTIASASALLLHLSIAVHLIEVESLLSDGSGDGYYLRRNI